MSLPLQDIPGAQTKVHSSVLQGWLVQHGRSHHASVTTRCSSVRPWMEHFVDMFLCPIQQLTIQVGDDNGLSTWRSERMGWCPTTIFQRACDLARRPSSSFSCASGDCSRMPPATCCQALDCDPPLRALIAFALHQNM